MYLKQLEIHGFKSFAEKIELNFVNAINAVVGPNGSGKSNISDAIRWVLGEQSVKSLRGSRMEDVIFAGSDKKKPLGFAEVSLCIDNSDKKIPVDYSEIHIMRRMYRSGESEYYINKTPCRLRDIYEIFMDTGIGRDGYSIIGQGRIDEILSNKSEERRLVFEEAAGIVKYKTRKQEAEKKLEQTKQNIIRLRDIIEEIEVQLEPLGQQAEVAKRYRGIMEDLKILEINLFIHQIDKHKSRLEAIKQELEGVSELIAQKTNLSSQLEAKQAEMKAQLGILENTIGALYDAIHGAMNLREKQDGECNVLGERIKNLEGNISRFEKRKVDLKEEYEKSNTAIEAGKAELSGLHGMFDTINCEIHSKTAEFDTKYQSISDMETDLSDKQQQFITLINSHSELKSKINSANAFIENIKKRIKQIQGDIAALENQQKEKEGLYIKSQKDLEESSRKLEDCKAYVETLKQRKAQIEGEIKALERQMNAARSETDTIASRLKVLEEMEKDFGGYSKSVKSLLQESGKVTGGFCGVIGEMIKVPSEYVTAIETALGAAVQNVVTETEEDAKRLIEHLKKNKAGRATFLPLTSVKPRHFNDRERKYFSQAGFIGIASELIQYDPKYSNAISNLLGRIAVVKDIDTAIALARASGYEFRIVTLSGEIINAGGSITGGSLNAVSSSVLSRKSEIEALKQKHEQKRQEHKDLGVTLENTKHKLNNNNIEIGTKTDVYHALQIEINNHKNRCENIKNDIQILKDRIALSQKEIQELNDEYRDSDAIIRENTVKAEALDEKKQALENEITDMQGQMKQLTEARDAYNKEITDLKVKLAAIEQNIKALEQSVSSLTTKVKGLQTEMQSNEQEIRYAQNETKACQAALTEKKAQIEIALADMTEKQNQLEEKEKEKAALMGEIEIIQDRVKESTKDITQLQGSLHKVEMQHTKAEMELENIEMKLLETYDMNYSKAVTLKDPEMNLNWAAKRSDELKGEIRAMGTVNVNAVEEYEKLSQRYTFLSAQVDDLEKARESLINVIAEICETMKSQFINEFHKINQNFNEVFAKLFGGGEARLVLSDEENVLESGIEIIAKPPGKKLQNLMLLSGGERALTAIALLFAILKMKPAPFCVLDEIDAALDDANVDRYAQFLVEFSKTTQFIIVTHRKGSMEVADCLYGVSMQDSGVSKLISVKMEDKEAS